jgi:hypothetical protein
MHTTTVLSQAANHGDGQLALPGLLAVLTSITDVDARTAGKPQDVPRPPEPPGEVPLIDFSKDLLSLGREALSYMKLLGLQRLPSPRLLADDLRYLTGPLIVFDPAWGEDIPDWLRATVRPARLGLLLAGEKESVSEEEAVAYLMTASLAQPLDHDWSQRYLRLGARVLARWGLVSSETDLWRQLGEELPPRNQDQDDEALRRLRSWLRRRVADAGVKTRPANRTSRAQTGPG